MHVPVHSYKPVYLCSVSSTDTFQLVYRDSYIEIYAVTCISEGWENDKIAIIWFDWECAGKSLAHIRVWGISLCVSSVVTLTGKYNDPLVELRCFTRMHPNKTTSTCWTYGAFSLLSTALAWQTISTAQSEKGMFHSIILYTCSTCAWMHRKHSIGPGQIKWHKLACSTYALESSAIHAIHGSKIFDTSCSSMQKMGVAIKNVLQIGSQWFIYLCI